MDNQLVAFLQSQGGSLAAAARIVARLSPEERQQLIEVARSAGNTLGAAVTGATNQIRESVLSSRAESMELSEAFGGQGSNNLALLEQANRAAAQSHLSKGSMEGTPTEASRAAGVGEGSTAKGSGETPITPQNPQYGLPDTTTLILPWTQYFTPVTFSNFACIDMSFRMNSLYDCAIRTLGSPTAGTAITEGVYNTQPGSTTTWPNPALSYPTTSTATTGESPQWRDYFDVIYSKYAVLGCEWTLTVCNPMGSKGADVAVIHGYDAFSATNAGRKFPTERTINQMEHWPDLTWNKVQSNNDATQGDNFLVIKGQYRPGDATRNVQNDEDVKRWTDVGSVPTLQENLVLFFARNGLNYSADKLAVKCKMQIKYIAQLKDKTVNARYPASGQTAISHSVPTDVFYLV